MSKTFPLTQGFVAIVDNDFETPYRWSYSHGYAKRTQKEAGVARTVYMHRLIMGAREGEAVDHINGNKLDNRKCNLRIGTHQQNGRGFRKLKGQYRGIHHEKCANRYVARIGFHGVTIHLGSFRTAEAAARAYDKAARIYFATRAQFNFPEEHQ